jgi:hypothetical protein
MFSSFYLNMFYKRSVSPLIATILIIVVSVILVTVVLTWGKSFVSDHLSSSSSLVTSSNTDRYQYIRLTDSKNGRFFFTYSPPQTITDHNFTITSFTYNGGHEIPLPEEKIITTPGIFTLDLGILDTDPFFINLIFADNYYLSFKDLTTTSSAPNESDCPSGFIPVPGNHLYGTVYSKGGFCVAQYEMKMDYNSDGIGDLVVNYPDCNTDSLAYNTWSYLNCSNGTIVSTKEGSPIARITQEQAIPACEDIGGHLITNDEWMTLARNIEMVKDNWSGGEIGVGYLPRGNTNLGGAGTSLNPEGSGETKRTLKLTNGQIIWDLPGNVWEWTNDEIDLSTNRPTSFNNSGEIITTNGFYNYFLKDPDPSAIGYIKYDSLGSTTLKYKDLFLLTNGNYNVDNGIGRIYLSTSTGRVFLRGGDWNTGPHAGLLALYLRSGASSRSYNIGFRCAVVP